MLKSNSNKVQDKLLVRQLQDGNSHVFDVIYDKYWDSVYSAAYKRLKDADYAQDITQDIFLQLWLRRKELVIDNLSAYLFTAVRNNVYKWLEKEQKYTPISELLEQVYTAKDQTDAGIIGKEFMVCYEALINTLTPSRQEIFRMRFHEDLSTAEIAKKLKISRKTVQNQLGRSIAQLRQSMGLLMLLLILHP